MTVCSEKLRLDQVKASWAELAEHHRFDRLKAQTESHQLAQQDFISQQITLAIAQANHIIPQYINIYIYIHYTYNYMICNDIAR